MIINVVYTTICDKLQSKWKCDPFSAYKDSEGNIFGRGTQDMKCVGIQYLEAIRRLKAKGLKPKRTIHVTFIPGKFYIHYYAVVLNLSFLSLDEELGGGKGMVPFVKSSEFQKMNIGFCLDEGGACPDDNFLMFNNERALWRKLSKLIPNVDID